MLKKLVMISLRENPALSGASRKECLGPRNTSQEVRVEADTSVGTERWLEREVIALVCSSDVDLVNSERVVK